MRLSELVLSRYGHFTDFSIHFGEKKPDEPDFHIIYGSNEAGKTTLFQAWLDFLYGIEERSRYNFLHTYNTMQIEASLELKEDRMTLSRIKGRQNTLRDKAGHSVPDAMLQAYLYGLDRESYRTMFSLDRGTLEKGGESILASEGELGRLLFAGSSGLASFSETLQSLREETEQFFIPGSRRKTVLRELVKKLGDIKDKIKQLDTDASTFSMLQKNLKCAQTDYEAIRENNNKKQAELALLNRKKAALPYWHRLRMASAQLEKNQIITLPPDWKVWRKDIPQLQEKEIQLAERQNSLSERLQELEEILKELPRDETVLREQERLSLLEQAYTKHAAAMIDLPQRRKEHFDKNQDIERTLQRLGDSDIKDPSVFLLSASKVQAIRRLIQESVSLDARLKTTSEELNKATENLEFALKERPKTDSVLSEETSRTLTRILERIRNSSVRLRLVNAQRDVVKKEKQVQDACLALAPWIGTAEDLKTQVLPEAHTLQDWKQSLQSLDKKQEKSQEKSAELERNYKRLLSEKEAFKKVEGLLTPKERAALREERNQAWQRHKKALSPETAEQFETTLIRDDQATTQEIHSAQSLAKFVQLEKDIFITAAEKQQEHKRREEVQEAYQKLITLISENIRSICPALYSAFSKNPDLVFLEHWLAKRKQTLDKVQELETAKEALHDIEQEQSLFYQDIVKVFQQIGLPIPELEDWDGWLSQGEVCLQQAKMMSDHALHTVQLQSEKQKRERAFELCKQDHTQWYENWRHAFKETWLEKLDQKQQSPDHIQHILDIIPVLEKLIDESRNLNRRIRDMEADCQYFMQEVNALAETLGLSQNMIKDKSEATQLWTILKERIQNAIRVEEDYKEKSSLRTRMLEAIENNQLELKALSHRSSVILQGCNASSFDQALESMQCLEENLRLVKEREQAEQDALQALGVDCYDALENTLGALSRETLQYDIDQCEAEKDQMLSLLQESYARLQEAQKDLDAVSADSSVVRANTEYQTMLLELKEQAESYFKQTAGILAAERALELYRETHRSSMMQKASEAFSTISQGAYQRLTTRTDEHSRETLLALGCDGSSKEVSALSDGTRFQLYLALRIAGYMEFASTRTPIPFIADDILEPFDDFRAIETFREFEGMARKGQVIYLTHHQHLCDLARKNIPSVKVHTL